jgi:hypothetical protein
MGGCLLNTPSIVLKRRLEPDGAAGWAAGEGGMKKAATFV